MNELEKKFRAFLEANKVDPEQLKRASASNAEALARLGALRPIPSMPGEADLSPAQILPWPSPSLATLCTQAVRQVKVDIWVDGYAGNAWNANEFARVNVRLTNSCELAMKDLSATLIPNELSFIWTMFSPGATQVVPLLASGASATLTWKVVSKQPGTATFKVRLVAEPMLLGRPPDVSGGDTVIYPS